MLKLTIETQDAQTAANIQAAYDYSIESNTFEQFETALSTKLSGYDLFIGRGGNHIFISDNATGERKAIIIL